MSCIAAVLMERETHQNTAWRHPRGFSRAQSRWADLEHSVGGSGSQGPVADATPGRKPPRRPNAAAN